MDCTEEDGFTLYGSDDSEEMRATPPATLPSDMQIGSPVSGSSDFYINGTLEGALTFTGTILGRSPVDTLAGYFEDCIVILSVFEFPNSDPQIFMEWWAEDVGMVFHKGVAGEGAKKVQELLSYDLTP